MGGEVLDLQQRWGSSLTRSQSPRMLAESTISMMQQPGSTLSHQRPTIKLCLPSESISPQAGWGGGTPTPRNDSVASAMITTPSSREPSTMAVLRMFGRMWRSMIVNFEQPATIARRTNSRSFKDSTSPRVTRA